MHTHFVAAPHFTLQNGVHNPTPVNFQAKWFGFPEKKKFYFASSFHGPKKWRQSKNPRSIHGIFTYIWHESIGKCREIIPIPWILREFETPTHLNHQPTRIVYEYCAKTLGQSINPEETFTENFGSSVRDLLKGVWFVILFRGENVTDPFGISKRHEWKKLVVWILLESVEVQFLV